MVTLPGNPTTGFQWEVVAVDQAILLSQGDAIFVPESNLTGAGGKCIFRFQPIEVGSTWLKMAYRRLWEKDVPPVGRFEVSITVTDGGGEE
jgi:inhibitor of cysteine peptidase